MKTYTTKGYINAILAAVSYGTNPLFALPMYSQGFGVNSVLFYRYLFAVLIYGLWLKLFKNTSFKISLKELFILFVFGIIFSFSSVFLFGAFTYIPSGLACTILFAYPLIVALISRLFFKEHLPMFDLLEKIAKAEKRKLPLCCSRNDVLHYYTFSISVKSTPPNA